VKVTFSVPPAAGNDVGDTLNAAASFPVFVTVLFPVIFAAVTASVCAADVEPMVTSPKSNDSGLTVMVGTTPVPLNVTVLSTALALLKVSVALYVCAAVGSKVTLTLPPVAGNDVCEMLNAPAPAPVFVIVIFSLKFTPVTVTV
jgi:hypothetical protein